MGSYMKKKGFTVISGDVQYFAHFFQMALIENNDIELFQTLKTYLHVSSANDLEEYLSEIISLTVDG